MELTEAVLLALKAIGLIGASFVCMTILDLYFIQPTRR